MVYSFIHPYTMYDYIIIRQLKEAKQKFVSLKRSQQQADKQRLEESKKLNNSGGAETNGDINVSKSLTSKLCMKNLKLRFT